MPQIILQQDLHVKLRNTKHQFLWIFDDWQPPAFGGAGGRHGTTWMPKVRDSIHELLPSALRSLASAKWGGFFLFKNANLLCVRLVVLYHVYLFGYYIGWFSTLLVFQCKCSDVRCCIFGISLAQAFVKLCAKLFSWLSYLIFDHAWARARPGWSVPGQK